MLKTIAIVFGVVFILVGILGFIPSVSPHEHLLGIFHVNAAHNVVHLLSGAVAVVSGMCSTRAAQIFFRVFGFIYGLVAVIGFFVGDQPIFGLISNNMADVWLHLGIAVSSLFLGFGVRDAAP